MLRNKGVVWNLTFVLEVVDYSNTFLIYGNELNLFVKTWPPTACCTFQAYNMSNVCTGNSLKKQKTKNK